MLTVAEYLTRYHAVIEKKMIGESYEKVVEYLRKNMDSIPLTMQASKRLGRLQVGLDWDLLKDRCFYNDHFYVVVAVRSQLVALMT
jgi:hypothetical protein